MADEKCQIKEPCRLDDASDAFAASISRYIEDSIAEALVSHPILLALREEVDSLKSKIMSLKGARSTADESPIFVPDDRGRVAP
jgi:hypothetical protein